MARQSALVALSLWAEPFGIVAVEAICRGVPVVASAPGGLAETVVHGISGLTFPAGSEDGLLRCLLSFARGEGVPDRRDRSRRGRRGPGGRMLPNGMSSACKRCTGGRAPGRSDRRRLEGPMADGQVPEDYLTAAGTGFARVSVRHAGITCLPNISID